MIWTCVKGNFNSIFKLYLVNLKVSAIERKATSCCCPTWHLKVSTPHHTGCLFLFSYFLVSKNKIKNMLTKIVPLTTCEFASFIQLHEKHVVLSHNTPVSWPWHPLSGGCMEFAVSPIINEHPNQLIVCNLFIISSKNADLASILQGGKGWDRPVLLYPTE